MSNKINGHSSSELAKKLSLFLFLKNIGQQQHNFVKQFAVTREALYQHLWTQIFYCAVWSTEMPQEIVADNFNILLLQE